MYRNAYGKQRKLIMPRQHTNYSGLKTTIPALVVQGKTAQSDRSEKRTVLTVAKLVDAFFAHKKAAIKSNPIMKIILTIT